MNRPPLHLATATDAPETTAQRVKRLQAEARALARDHVRALTVQLAQAQQTAGEIADGGDVFPPGARDVARRLVEDIGARIGTLDAIIGRSQ